MVNDVETVLKEIRERVIAENRSNTPASLSPPASAIREGQLQVDSNDRAAFDRLSAQLAITARAWDRLPPVISNRRGALRRLEIAVKKVFRPLTRWFTWEQVNFNAATHHALLDALALLKAHEEDLRTIHRVQEAHAAQLVHAGQLRIELKDVKEHLARVDATLKRYSDMMSELAAEMRKGHAELTKEIHTRSPELALAIQEGLKKVSQDFEAKLAGVVHDLHEEQRVCFTQLSLESSEAAVLEDRARRALLSRVEKLEKDAQASK